MKLFFGGLFIFSTLILSLLFQIDCFPYDSLSTYWTAEQNISSDPLNSSCFCDKTVKVCDPFCCCDPACASVSGFALYYWKARSQCLQAPVSQYFKFFPNCQNTNLTAEISDLNIPLRVFYQTFRNGFCLAYDNGNNFNKTIVSNYTVTNSSDFTNLVSTYKNTTKIVDKTFLYNSNTFAGNIPNLFTSNFLINNYTGYLPNDPIIRQLGINLYDALTIPIVDPFGRCHNDLDLIRHMRGNDFTCSYKFSYTNDNCANFNQNNIPYSISYPLLSFNSTSNSGILIQPKIKIYKVTKKLYYTSTSYTGINDVGINVLNFADGSNNCLCTNMVTGVIQDFLMQNETITGYDVTYYLEDMTNSCSKIENVPVQYKVNFKSADKLSTYSRSGNPGYIKGKPLIAGYQANRMVYNNVSGLNNTIKYIDQYSLNRLLYGAGQLTSDRGLCYYNTPLSGVDEFLLPNKVMYTIPTNSDFIPYFNFSSLISENGIYNNPRLDNTLTFEDSISWGCVDKLNITGLKYYCTNQLWKNKMIFNIVNNITHLSQFGNPNRHYSLDWVSIADFSFDTYQSTWDDTYHKCTIPAVLNVDILFGTYGAVNNTQLGIFEVKFRMDYVYWWSKSIIDKSAKDNFFTNVNVNYIQVPTDTVWWFAPGPGFIVLPRNILYPFRIGTTNYGMQSSGRFYTKESNLLNLILILLFIFAN